MATSVPSHALTWKDGSVLSSGKWAKVKVTETGIQEISYQQLRELGFENPESVTVFGYGASYLNNNSFLEENPDDLPQTPVLHNNGRILFYGESHYNIKIGKKSAIDPVRNHYSLASYYYITDSQPAIEPMNISYIASLSTCQDSHSSLQCSNPVDINPMRAGVYFFSKDITENPEVGEITFTLPDREPNTTANISGVLISDGPQTFTVEANGKNVATQYLSGTEYAASTLSATLIPAETLDQGETLKISLKPEEGAEDYAGYEHIAMSYSRMNRMDNLPELKMIINRSFQRSQVRIFNQDPADIVVWNITNPSFIKKFDLGKEVDESGMTNTIVSINSRCSPSVPETHHHLIAFHPAASHHKPEIEGIVENQDLHAMDTPDMLIITIRDCLPQAQRLAQLHKTFQGMDVAVVCQEDIFNEFSSGSPTPMAYRRMAKMLYDRDSEKFRYLLLLGPSIYDNRGLLPHNVPYSPDKMLLSYQIDNITLQCAENTSVSTDAFFGMLNDNATAEFIATNEGKGYNSMVISVGRVPAQSDAEAKIYVDKVEKYLSEGMPAQAQTRSLIFSDDGDNDMHIISAESVALTQRTLIPYAVLTRAHNGIYPWNLKMADEGQRKIINTLKEGVDLMMYYGHGRPDAFTAEGLWDRESILKARYNCYPLTFFASCNSFGFDRRENSMGELALFTPEGGTIALIGTTRTVFNDENRALGEFMFKELSKAEPEDTYGNIFRKARNLNYYDRQYTAARATVNAYNFGGDPALPAFRPAYNISLVSVNDTPCSESGLALQPLQKNKIEAQVTDSEGNIQTDYNGSVIVSIYEAARTTPNLYQDKTAQAGRRQPEVKVEDDLLCRFTLPVVNGNISGDIILPVPTRPDEKCRMVFAAEFTGDHYRNAIGMNEDVTVTDVDPNRTQDETPTPRIEALYLNTPDFTDGSLTSDNPVLIARISSQNNVVNAFSSGVSVPVKAVMDNRVTITGLQYSMHQDEDGTIHINHQLSDIPEGNHYITLYIADVYGLVYYESIHFQVVNTTSEITLQTENSIVKDEVTFNADHTFAGDFTARLILMDNTGKHIRTVENVTFPYTWNLTDSQNEPLPSGSYTARAVANDGVSFCGSPTVRFTVIR